MSQEISKPKDIINTIYHAAMLFGLTVGYSMIGKKIIKFEIGDPSRDYKTIFKLVIPVSLSVVTKDWLVSQVFLPNYVINNKKANIILTAALTIGSAIHDQFKKSDTEKHNRAIEKLNDEITKYNKERQLTLDYINYQMYLQ